MKWNLIVDAGHGAIPQIEVRRPAVLQIEIQIIYRELAAAHTDLAVGAALRVF